MAGFSVPQYTFFYNGQVAANGSVYVYQTGTTMPVTVYSDGNLTAPITNPINLDQNGQCVFYVSGTSSLKLVAYNGLNGTGILIETIDPVYPVNSSASSSVIPWALAGGTPDAITATYSPVVSSLTDGLLLSFRAAAANTTTIPSFSPNGLTAYTITQKGGAALVAGSIAASLAEYIIRYNLAHTRWELLNPTVTTATFAPINSPAFTGTPTAPTPSAADNSTNIATTAYVQANKLLPAGNQVGALITASYSGTAPWGSSIAAASITPSFCNGVGSGDIISGTWQNFNTGNGTGESQSFQRIA